MCKYEYNVDIRLNNCNELPLDKHMEEILRDHGIAEPEKIVSELQHLRSIDVYRDNKNVPVTTTLLKVLHKNDIKLPNVIKSNLCKEIAECYGIAKKIVLYDVEAFDRITVNDGKSCFRKHGCNRHHYHMLEQCNKHCRYVVVYDNNDYAIARFWLWDMSYGLVAHNYYGHTRIENIPIIIRELGKRYRPELPDEIVEHPLDIAIYVNDGIAWVYGASPITVIREINDIFVTCPTCGARTYLGNIIDSEDIDEFRCVECNNKITCSQCWEYVPDDMIVIVGNTPYCYECFNEKYFVCDKCDEVFPKDEVYLTPNEEPLCWDCFSEKYFICDECGEVFRKNKAYTAPDEALLCRDCFNKKYFYCEECGEIFERDTVVLAFNEAPLCQDCFKEKYFICEKCKEIYPKEDKHEINYLVFCSYCNTALQCA